MTKHKVPQREALITRSEAAQLFHVTERTIDRWLHAGTLKPVRIGRRVLIPKAEIEDMLNASNSGYVFKFNDNHELTQEKAK